MYTLLHLAVLTLTVLALARLLPGVHIRKASTAIVVAVVFSLLNFFIGWLIKVLVVRFGGTDLFRAARNFFIGMIIGEAGAAACWLVVCLFCNALGITYHAIHLFPE